MKIGKRLVSGNQPPLIIAELGINHGGCIKTAKKLVDAAASSGCECIKHQTHLVEDEMTEHAKSVKPPNADNSIWEIISESSLTMDEEIELKTYTENLGLIYISTPFSRSAADFLYEIGVPAFKIGSGELDNLLLLEHVANFGLPIIMSTGMHSFESITRSVEILERSRISYALLECTSEYPAKPQSIRLSSISKLKQMFPRAVVGFSDHSLGPTMSIAATALGAKIIERHFTDTKYRSGPDIICSMDPSELRYLRDKTAEVHAAMNSTRERSETESAVYKFARSSIVADKNLRVGQKITSVDIWARRPGTGEIPGYEFQKVLGKTIKHNILKNTQLSWQDFTD